MQPSDDHVRLLRDIARGVRLMDHRDIEGAKSFMLHPLDGEAREVDAQLVHDLVEAGLISSNKKFPAATYWLTERGRRVVVDFAPAWPGETAQTSDENS